MQKPLFIAFEGIDGSGKSTQAKLLADRLNQVGQKTLLTCEPTKDQLGNMIRDAFAHKTHLHDEVIAGLFVADRLQHILDDTNGILATLQKGTHVVSDRYVFSSYAYQGVHTDIDWVIQANSLAAKLAKADLTLFIQIDPAVAMARIMSNREVTEKYETLENLNKVHKNYLKSFDLFKNKENIVLIDGNKPMDEISNEIFEKVKEYIV
jgi:dTMP kinase